MTYLDLLKEADMEGLDVREKPLHGYNGRIYGNRIAIRRDIPAVKKACVLAEEIGHHATTVGKILDLSKVENRKQERKARRWAHNHMISQQDLVNAAKHGCRSAYDTAEFLDVTEEFLEEAIQDFRQQYGSAYYSEDFMIQYEPYLLITDLEEGDQ